MADPVASPVKPAAKKIKYRVRAVQMIWNGHNRIREGTVFDFEWEEGKKLPRCVERVEEKEAVAVSLGKRERDNVPTNLAKDQPARPALGK